MAGHFSVPNLGKFQHYKDRTPPWIKLHNSVLEDYEFTCLQDASKAHLVLIWLLASRTGNRIPDDPTWVAQKIGATEGAVDLAALSAAGFLTYHAASGTLADCKQSACLEGEGEGEGEGEERESRGAGGPPWGKVPPAVHAACEEWVEYRRVSKLKAWQPVTWRKQFEAFKGRPDAFVAAVERSIANGWQGLFEAKQKPKEPGQVNGAGVPWEERKRLMAIEEAEIEAQKARERQERTA